MAAESVLVVLVGVPAVVAVMRWRRRRARWEQSGPLLELQRRAAEYLPYSLPPPDDSLSPMLHITLLSFTAPPVIKSSSPGIVVPFLVLRYGAAMELSQPLWTSPPSMAPLSRLPLSPELLRLSLPPFPSSPSSPSLELFLYGKKQRRSHPTWQRSKLRLLAAGTFSFLPLPGSFLEGGPVSPYGDVVAVPLLTRKGLPAGTIQLAVAVEGGGVRGGRGPMGGCHVAVSSGMAPIVVISAGQEPAIAVPTGGAM